MNTKRLISLLLTLCLLLTVAVVPAARADFTEMVIKVVSGANHTVALLSDGSVWAWGKNDMGQVGDTTNTTRFLPVRVPLPGPAADIAAGGNHSFAILSDGTLMAWGNNKNGQLGDGTTANRNRPVVIYAMQGVQKVAAGFSHTLAIDKDGTLRAWGKNDYGQLGRRNNINSLEPRLVLFEPLTDADYDAQKNELPDNQPKVLAIAAGYQHSVATLADGRVMSFGGNTSGELGDKSTLNKNMPVEVGELPGTPVSMAAGADHTLFLFADGTLYGCGSNKFGQLSPLVDIPVHDRPFKLTDGVKIGADNATISAGYQYSTAVLSAAAPGGGNVKTWGNNDWGQLGNGMQGGRGSFYVTLPGAVRVAAGYYHAEVLDTAGQLWGWAYNGFGELGDGTYLNRMSPVALPMQVFYEDVATVSDIRISPIMATWKIGVPFDGFAASLLPLNALDKSVEWSVSHTSVADIDAATGVITAKKAGTVTVYAKAYNGRTAEAQLTVKADPASVRITSAPTRLVNVGTFSRLNAEMKPTEVYDGTMVWKIVDDDGSLVESNDVAFINPTSGVLTALGNGTVRIRVYSGMKPDIFDETTVECGIYTRKITLQKDGADTARETVNIDYNVSPPVQGTVTLTAVISPANTRKSDVVWSSTNQSVAAVTPDPGNPLKAVVTAMRPGYTTITATATDGSMIFGTCGINVVPITMGLELSEYDKMIAVGEAFSLKAFATPNRAGQEVVWSLRNEDSELGKPVASVSQSGVVKGLSPGTVEVVATAADGSGKSAYCTLRVITPLARVVIVPSAITLNVDDPARKQTQLNVTYTPSHASIQELAWSTSNNNVATVDDFGLVTATGPGTCKIYGNAKDGSGKSTAAQITVITNADSLTLNYTEYPNLALGRTLVLKASLFPASSDQNVTWTLSPDSPQGVATVSDTGVVRAFGTGTVTVLCTARSNPSLQAQCVVTCVVPPTYAKMTPAAASIYLTKADDTTYIPESVTAMLTVLPANYTRVPITCVSSNQQVADVERNNGEPAFGPDGSIRIWGKLPGTATLSFTVGGMLTAVKVTVLQTATDLTIVPPLSNLLYKSKTLALRANVTPLNGDQTVIWESSAPSVASVNQKGQVTALAAGEVVIRATSASNPMLYDEIFLTCEIPVSQVKLSKNILTMAVGEVTDLPVTITPANAYLGAGWTVKSTRTDVLTAAVSQYGDAVILTALKSGSSTITVTAGDKTFSCAVTVKEVPGTITITNKPAEGFLLLKGAAFTLKAKITPANAFTDIVWSSSDETVATISKLGVVTVKGKGSVTFTAASAFDEELFDEVTIQCAVPVTSIRLSQTSLTLRVGDSVDVTATVNPDGGYYSPGKGLLGKSNNTNITVTQNGDTFTVTANKAGTATLTVTCGGKSVLCRVTIKA